MGKISEILKGISKQRPLFHSEADFQHALAWAIHQEIPHASVRLELPILIKGRYIHIDAWIEHRGEIIAIELKYKTRSLSVRVGNEQFTLKSQSAQDIGRYDYLKDIQRLEQVVVEKEKSIGYAILLTNDNAYWTEPKDRGTVDAEFRIHDGRVITGAMQWGAKASEGTKRNREQPIVLRDTFTIKWEDYSRPSLSSYGAFRFAVIEVLNNQSTA